MTLSEEVITIFLIALHLGQNSLILIRPPNYFIIISSQSGPEIYVAAIYQPVLEAFSRAFSSQRLPAEKFCLQLHNPQLRVKA